MPPKNVLSFNDKFEKNKQKIKRFKYINGDSRGRT